MDRIVPVDVGDALSGKRLGDSTHFVTERRAHFCGTGFFLKLYRTSWI